MKIAAFLALLWVEGSSTCALAMPQRPGSETDGRQRSESTVILREMTEVSLQFAEDVNSRSAKEGQTIELVLAKDLSVGDVIVAKAGSRAIGAVVHSKRPDFWGEAGELHIRVTSLKAGNTKVSLRGAAGEVGKRYVVARGSQAVMKRGTPVTAYVNADTSVPLIESPPATGVIHQE